MAKRARRPGRDPFDPLSGEPDEALDLHGFRAAEAELHVADWIRAAARRHRGGLLHIITGRGRGSPERPVLGPLVRRILRDSSLDCIGEWGPDENAGGFLIRVR